jgi:hypothetical protein
MLFYNAYYTPFDSIDVVDSQSLDPVTLGSASLVTAAAPPTLANTLNKLTLLKNLGSTLYLFIP